MKVPMQTVKLALGAMLIFVVTTAAGTGVRLAVEWPGAAAPAPAAGLMPYLPASMGATPALGLGSAYTDPLATAPIPGVPGYQISEKAQFAQIAGILTRMRPVEAAVLIQHLEDEHCVAILSSMSVRDCTAILQALPEGRRSTLQEKLFSAAAEAGR